MSILSHFGVDGKIDIEAKAALSVSVTSMKFLSFDCVGCADVCNRYFVASSMNDYLKM